MDILTQAVLGAATAQWGAKKHNIRKAAVIGAFAGLLPDADVLIRSATDPMFGLEMHRHFSHSLPFIPVGGLIAALLLYYFYRKSLTFKEVYLYSLLGCSTHGLLDSFTTYGTRLLWPFSQTRYSFDIVSIIDPVYTIPLLIFVIFACIKFSTKIAKASLVFCILFFSFGFVQHQRVKSEMLNIAAENNHRVESYVLLPTIGNNILWKATYKSGDKFYTNAIRVNWFGDVKRYGGDFLQAADANTAFPELGQNSTQRLDLKKFNHFASGFIAFDKENPNVIVDARYSINPANVKPMWAVEVDTKNPNNHLKFGRNGVDRLQKENIETFKKMLWGYDL
jgi:inner membrane protein